MNLATCSISCLNCSCTNSLNIYCYSTSCLSIFLLMSFPKHCTLLFTMYNWYQAKHNLVKNEWINKHTSSIPYVYILNLDIENPHSLFTNTPSSHYVSTIVYISSCIECDVANTHCDGIDYRLLQMLNTKIGIHIVIFPCKV